MKKLTIIILFLISYSANSQSLSLFNIDTSSYPNISAKFWYFDKDGNQMNGLSPSDFELKENGEIKTITNISCPPPTPPKALSSVLVIDVSGSMRGRNIDLAKAGALAWVNALSLGKSECAITSFDTDNYLNQDFTTDRKLLVDAITPLEPKGGTDYNKALISPMAGGLQISKYGKHQKVIVFLTDGSPNTTPKVDSIVNEANNQNCIIYCVVLGMEAPESVKQIAEQTGGVCFDKISTVEQIENIYLTILLASQGGEPCTINWLGKTSCEIGFVEVDLKLNSNNTIAKSKYHSPFSSVTLLEFNPSVVKFNNPPIGLQVSEIVTVTARNATFNVSNISLSNTKYSISPTNFIIQPNESIDLTVSYTATDSGYTIGRYSFINDQCEQYNFYASGRWKGEKPTLQTLKITQPNGGETYIIGSDSLITWEGLLPTDTVRIDYSIDKGVSWELITKEASGLKYKWTNIPKPESNECLIKLKQYVNNNPVDSVLLKNTLIKHANWVYSVKFSPDGKLLASGSWDSTIIIWDVLNEQYIKTLVGHKGDVYSVCFSPDGKMLASGSSDNTVMLWDIENDTLIHTFTGHNKEVSSVCFSPDGTMLASGSLDFTIKLWDVSNKVLIQTLTEHNEGVSSVCFSPNGTMLASGSYDKTAIIWEVSTKQLIQVITEHTGIVNCVSFSPDGSILASGGTDKTIILWDILNGQPFRKLSDFYATVFSISFSPDGFLLACGTSEKSILLWDLLEGQLIRKFTGHASMVESVCFSPDGRMLASGSSDNTLKLWNIDEEIVQKDVSDSVFSIVLPLASSIPIEMGEVPIGVSKDSVVSEFISNIGLYPFRVDSIYIRSYDVNAFSLVSGFPKYIVPTNSSNFCEFRFTPNRVGYHSGDIVIITQSDTLKKRITGIGVEHGLKVMAEHIDFGSVYVGQYKDTLQLITVKNMSKTPTIVFETKHNLPNVNDFSTRAGGGNFTLAAGEEREMDLRFAPSSAGRTSGTLEFHHNKSATPNIIQLFGEGLEQVPANIVLETIPIEANVGKRIEIPIILNAIENLEASGITSISIDLTFNPTILSPIGYKVDIIDNKTGKIKIENMPISGIAGEVLKTITFRAGLGNAENCDLILSNPVAVGGVADITMINGKFTLLGICEEGGTRLINPSKIAKINQISPNPSEGNVKIDINLIESGTTSLKIVDVNGQIIEERNLDNQIGEVNVEINKQGYSNGIYFIQLETPTIVLKEKIIITK